MKIHCIIHADFEQPGYYEKWALAQGLLINSTHVYKGETLPTPNDFDLLLLMGGPQSPSEVDKFPYLAAEIKLIQHSVLCGKRIIGICLGAQLIGESYGATTEHSPNKEIGVFPLLLTDEGKKDPLFKHFPDTFLSGHWHNDMPGLPPGAKVLAESAGCPRQIIKFSPLVYGFQCHLEFDKACVSALIDSCPQDLVANTYVQTADEIRAKDYAAMNQHLKMFLDHFILGNSSPTMSTTGSRVLHE